MIPTFVRSVRRTIFLFAVFMTLLSIHSATSGAEPPVAEKHSHLQERHGIEWNDDYFWLRERENPAVRAYLEAENSFLAATLAPLQKLRETLVEEMKGRIIDDDVSVPYRRGNWWYYSREVAGKDHPLICRKPSLPGQLDLIPDPASCDGEGIVLDLNVRANGDDAYSFGGGSVSSDGKRYAWKENHDGTDLYTIRVKELESGEIRPDEIEGSLFDEAPVWALDNETIFYTIGDATDRSWRVKRHRLGSDAKEDDVVFEETDARFQVGIEATKSHRFLLITSASKDTSETSLLSLTEPKSAPHVFEARREGIRYSLGDRGDFWYILTNDGAVNGRLLKVPMSGESNQNRVEVLPGDEHISYGGMEAFKDHLVLSARKEGITGFYLLDPDKETTRWITSPGVGGSLQLEKTPNFDSTTQRFSYETLLQPYTVAEVEMTGGEIRTLKQKALPEGFDPNRYRIESTTATATDGTKLPIWLLLPADHLRDGSGGLLLDGYGAYGISSDPWFDSDIFSLVDRGVGFAIAQVRGGGEFGRLWYEAGKQERKGNTFTDYIACAEHLIAEGYTSSAQLCGTGASAGGLLAGAVINERPDLFAAFIANVPFVDVLNTMLDATLPLTTSEYDEWGDPASSPEIFERIRHYSPYDNVRKQSYPALLVLAGWNDNRVSYWEPAKWVAKIRTQNTGSTPPLLSTAFETGHGGASGRYSGLAEVALQYAFVLKALGRTGE